MAENKEIHATTLKINLSIIIYYFPIISNFTFYILEHFHKKVYSYFSNILLILLQLFCFI